MSTALRETMRTVKANQLKQDWSIYARCTVDKDHVFAMVEALRAGYSLPPIIVDLASYRIVDGFHRYSAFKQHYGLRCSIDIIEVEYPDERELVLDSIRRNACHGRPFSNDDRAKCVKMCDRLGIDEKLIANTLIVNQSVVGVLRNRAYTSELTPRLRVAASAKTARRASPVKASSAVAYDQVKLLKKCATMIRAGLADDSEVRKALKELTEVIEGLNRQTGSSWLAKPGR
jgi:hypothetical protein